MKRLNFADRESKLLAAFPFTTWLSDRLLLAPSLLICGPPQAIHVLRLLRCFCRRPLMLADLSPAGLLNLPADLHFSLLLNQPELTEATRRLLRASGHKGLYTLGNRGRLIDLFCPRVILTGLDRIDDIDDQAIQVVVELGQVSGTIDERVQCAIAAEFQSQMLMYRLKNCANLQVIEADMPDFAPSTRALASNLASCFQEDPDLAHELISLLQAQDQDVRAKQSSDIRSAIVMVLLGLIHQAKLNKISVEEIARLANALQRNKGQILEYSAEEIGWKLKQMNIPRHRTRSGSVIDLDSSTSGKVHRLAHIYGLASDIPGSDSCVECRPREATGKEGVVAV